MPIAMNNRLWMMLLMLIAHTAATAQGQNRNDAQIFSNHVYDLTSVMFHDVINPPAAARFYAYANLSAYCVVAANDGTLASPEKILKDFPAISSTNVKTIDLAFTTTYAMLETGRILIPSGNSLSQQQIDLYKTYLKAGVKKKILETSIAYALSVVNVVVEYAKKDGYRYLSSLTRYQPFESDSTWYPTPPEYMAAVEPNWKTIRPFFMDSARQFKPAAPIPFNINVGSPFDRLMKEVVTTKILLTKEQEFIAHYWDCNPFANFYSGHVNVAIKKISPGGHWMNITGIACKQARLSLSKTVQAHALVAMGLHDSFISCWAEKYASHRIRPKTVINRYVDEYWEPLLETPPFPEYSSGHSVISTSSAEILTSLLGDNFRFTDNTEVFFGMPERKFNSFREAANEAAISRLYGGIHFRDAIEQGQVQGKLIATFIISKIRKEYASN